MRRDSRLLLACPLLACAWACDPQHVFQDEPPTAPDVRILPARPDTRDELTVTVTEPAVDPEGATVHYTYSWSVDGNDFVEVGSSERIPPELTLRDELWTVTVTPSDGANEGPAADAFVLIGNTPPTVSAAFMDDTPDATVDLEVQTEVSDPDDDAVSLRWSWTLDGVEVDVAGGLVPASRTERGQVWEATVRPHDGTDEGPAVVVSATIVDSPPQADAVRIEPDPAYAGDTLQAFASGSDLDDDPLTWRYDWSVDGVLVQSGADARLAPTWFQKGQGVSVVATPHDGELEGSGASSATVSIANTAPEAPEADVLPDVPASGVDELRCVLTTEAFDADGDALTYRAVWTVDGEAYVPGGGTVSGGAFGGWVGASTALHTDDTVPAADILAGQEWTCELVPDDGQDEGPAGVDAVVVTDPGLAAWWSFDAGDAADDSGNGHTGSVTGASTTTGQVGSGMSFDGVNDYVRVDPTGLSFETALTVAAWVRSTADNDVSGVVTKRSCCDDSTDFEWSLQHNAGDMDFGVASAGAVAWAGISAYPSDTWTFFVGVYDGVDVVLYLDGVELTRNSASATLPETTYEVIIGARDANTGRDDFWAGQIDEVRLWSRALLPEEIAQLHDAEM